MNVSKFFMIYNVDAKKFWANGKSPWGQKHNAKAVSDRDQGEGRASETVGEVQGQAGTGGSVTALVPSVSIEALVMKRNAMVERLREAHRVLLECDELAENLFGEEHRGHRLALRNYSTGHEFTSPKGLEEAIKEIDGRAWSYLLRESGLQTFMDAEARGKWNKAIEKNDVPELTVETIATTFSSLYDKRGEMFERGVVEVFRTLSWDYKTNSPVMFGRRVILRYIVDVHGKNRDGSAWLGGVSHNGSNKLDDLVRVMSVLDGKPEPDYRNAIYRSLNNIRWMRDDGPSVAELDYFTVKGFRNGNGHLTFTRPDLVDKMNTILARRYPGALARSREEEASP